MYINADPAFGCWHHVVFWLCARVSEEHTTSIIRAEVTYNLFVSLRVPYRLILNYKVNIQKQ